VADVVFVVVRQDDGRVYGGEKSTIATAAALASRGFGVRFILTEKDDFAGELDALGIPWEVVPVRDPFAYLRAASPWKKLRRVVDIARVNLAVLRAGREARVVHTVATTGFFCALLGARLAGARVIYHVRCASRDQITQPMEEVAVLLADRTLAVSSALRTQLTTTGRRALRKMLAARVHVVENGFDFDAIDRAAAGPLPARAPGEFHVLFVGSVCLDKGQLRFIERVGPSLVAAIPGVRVTMVGDPRDPAYGEACRAAITRLGLDAHFHLAGYQPQSEVYRLTRAADVLVLPSVREGLPRCTIEAHALGVPVVATDVVGVAEVVHEDSGFLVPGDRVEDMVAPLARLAADPELRQKLGEAGRRRVRARFGLDRNAEAIAAIYHELGA
jgi:glycosyltransferase involved in cell wall biosynthesis